MKTTQIIASLVALAAVPAAAQGKFKFGLSASILNPMSDMAIESGTGFGLAMFAEYRFTGLMAGRLRYEYAMLGDKEVIVKASGQPLHGISPGTSTKYSSKAQITAADFIVGHQYKGIYGLVGVGLTSLDFDSDVYESSFSQPDSVATGLHDNLGGFGGSIGIGFNFTKHIGAEAKYTKMNVNNVRHSSFAYAQVLFLYKF